MPKPTHLTWEEAAVNALCNSTSYRMLVGHHGARMKQGDTVLIWGATGGIGGYATQYVLNGGGTPVGVVSSPDKVELLARARRRGGHRPQGRGLPVLVRRHDAGRVRVAALRQEDPRAGRRRPRHRVRAPRPPDDGGLDLRLQARGGTVVTCAATSGYMVEFDNRHFWMKLKRLIASHFANYAEACAANRLIDQGRIQPLLSAVYPLTEVGEAARSIHRNEHEGKIGVLCLAPAEGLGIDDPEKRGPRSARTGSPCSAATAAEPGSVVHRCATSARMSRCC